MKPKEPREPEPYPRILGENAARPMIVGQDSGWWTDLYQWLLRISWGMLFVVLAALYLGINAIFGALYLLDSGGIANARPGSYADTFFFSVQTLATIGYGVLAPKSFYANAMVTVEAFVGLIQMALTTGIVFARVSRPKARVMFSRHAVVTSFEGTPTFMFRIANQRGNQIMEAEVTVTLARQTVTREGHVMRRFEELAVVRRRSPLFALSWTVMHPIGESSPLQGKTRESLLEDQAEIVVILSGTDETYSDRIYARHSYAPREVHWNKRFADILGLSPDGRRRLLDLRKFHAIEDTDGS